MARDARDVHSLSAKDRLSLNGKNELKPILMGLFLYRTKIIW